LRWENAWITASPRASDVMKLGSPLSPSICAHGVGGESEVPAATTAVPGSFFPVPSEFLVLADRLLPVVAGFLAVTIFEAVGFLAAAIHSFLGMAHPQEMAQVRKAYTDLGDRRTSIPIIALTFLRLGT
jgi:hypothetical protein